MSTFIFYHGEISAAGARSTERLISDSLEKGEQSVTLCIASGGGNVNAGAGLFNFVRMMPVPINTHCFGLCGSIAATIFLAGEHRTVAPASIFILHAASFIEGPLLGQISPNTPMIYAPFKFDLDWPDERIAEYFGTAAEKHLTPEQSVVFGIAHEIAVPKMSNGDTVLHVDLQA